MRSLVTSSSTPRPYPTRGSPAHAFRSNRRSPGDRSGSRRPRLAPWLITPILLALMVAGASIATAARHTSPHPPSCGAATGATWHVKHSLYKYDQHGALVFDHNGPVRLPQVATAMSFRPAPTAIWRTNGCIA